MTEGLIPCLVQLRSEFNLMAPNRDKASDGWVGDAAHADSVSDHNWDETGNVPIRDADRVNEVHAIDVDRDLRLPDLAMEDVVQFLLVRCRMGLEKRLRYIIFNRYIWSASTGWRRETYTGANPHDHHAHFSASYDTKLEASTVSWELEELIMPSAEEIARAVWNHREVNPDAETPAGEPSYRMGGWARMDVHRNAEDHAELIERLTRLEEKVDNLSAGGES